MCGNAIFTSHDPVPTRGDPLEVDIIVSSHPILGAGVLGNGTFTYGAKIVLDTVVHGTPSNPARVLVDGRGYEHNFGQSGGASGPGIYSTLSTTSSGYTISNAGGLDSIDKAGNYTYEFDTNGLLLSITNPENNTQEITYNSSDAPTLIEDTASGKTVTINYNSSGLISEISENGGFAKREITYDSNDRIIEIKTLNSSSVTLRTLTYTYDSQGRVETFTKDGNSATTATVTYSADGYGRGLANVSYPTSNSPTFNYFASRTGTGAYYVTESINSKGGVTKIGYDVSGNVVYFKDPNYQGTSSAAITYTYDSNNNLLTEYNGVNTTTYTYNSLGLVIKKENTLGQFTEYTYSGVDLTEIEDNQGVISKFFYTDTALPHAITSFEDGAGNSWSISRNSYGQVTEVTPPTGSQTGAIEFEYEETSSSPNFGWLKSITNGAGDVVTFDSYTLLGDATSITTNPASGVTRTIRRTFDALQRETLLTNPDSTTVSTSYSGENYTVTDEASNSKTYTNCPECGKLTGVSGPMSWALSWTLDDDRDVTTFSDALSNNTTYTYGAAAELKEINFPDSQKFTYTYDAQRRLKTHSKGISGGPTFNYNSASQVTSAGGFSYTYDSAGRVLTAGNITYAYGSNRLVSSITYNFSSQGLSNSQVVEYEYYPDNLVKKITWKNGTTTVAHFTYNYDGAGRVSSVVNSFSETTSFTYDGEGKLLTQTNPNSTTKEIAYNNRAWPTNLTYKLSGTTTQSYALTYDGGSNTVGNITQIVEPSDTVTYAYDSLYRLTSESKTGFSRTFAMDLSGNVTTVNGSSFATFDAANKITNILGKAVTNEVSGSIKTIATTSPVTFKSATWNGLDRATSVTPTSGTVRNYQYLYDGKRFFSQVGSGTKTFYIFAGDTLIGEIEGTTPKVAYTWAPEGLLTKRDLVNSLSYFYEYGAQGETRKLRNSSGTVTDSYTYNAYGEVLSSSGSTVNPYRYGGKYGYYTEVSTGLILATQRWYSPQLMRWITRDPILFEGGVNVYEYVGGNPVNYFDATGEERLKNNTGQELLYKPEGGDKPGENLKICLPGEICDMDGYYPPDPNQKPRKVRDYFCYGSAIGPDYEANCYLWGCEKLGPHFFETWKNWANPYKGTNGWENSGREIIQ